MKISAAEYLDRAKAATNTQTDSNLARKIGVSRAAVALWRSGQSVPSDETMLRLADRAKLDPQEALILLNLWRAKGEAKDVYARMVKIFAATAGGIILAISLLWGNIAKPLNNNELYASRPVKSHVQGGDFGREIMIM